MSELLAELKAVVGDAGYLAGEDMAEKYRVDWIKSRDARPALVLRPATTEEVSAILRLCHQAGQPVTPQGGLTGLVAAAAPMDGEIALTLERMNAIEETDPSSATMTVQAGVALQTVQEEAESHEMLFPLDLGARGSCTIGGNLSTNAGGNRVIRYGMMRDLVLGLEVVLADGTVLSNMNKLLKNNTGYDLKQLFIGGEGTLGIVTRVVLRLFPAPRTQSVAFCALDSFNDVLAFLRRARAEIGADLSAFEVIWRDMYAHVIARGHDVRPPLAADFPFYVLIESLGSRPEHDAEAFAISLDAMQEDGLLRDAVVAQSQADVARIWHVRDAIPESISDLRPVLSYDISLSNALMPDYEADLRPAISAQWPEARIMMFGHLGDSNLHLVISIGENSQEHAERGNEIVYDLVGEYGGSVSAEHGIGLAKRAYLGRSRGADEIATMKCLKRALDPKNILSPGRIFELN